MGLLQQAVKTYDCMEKIGLVGKYREGKTVLAPVSHIITRADLEVTINAEGEFVSASAVGAKDPKIIIPATESSAGRTSGISAHPLCEQLGYLITNNKGKYEAYVHQLEDWLSFDPTQVKLRAVLSYVKKGCLLTDLVRCGLVELNGEGTPKNEKMMVRWSVVDVKGISKCWEDPALYRSFIAYYDSLFDDEKRDLCMITGETTRIAAQHPKGIVPANGNAKLISSNDTSGFTYLGRFMDADQAAEIGYEASQKAHNALRWLVANEGAKVVFGGRTFICWNPEGFVVKGLCIPFLESAEPIRKPSEYRRKLQDVLDGWKHQENLPAQAGVVIAAFDAATSGRLALTYYNELMYSDFVQRLHDWDAHCCWYNGRFGIQSPSLWQIVNCAFGTQQGDRLKTDDRVMRQQMQRLVACRIDKAKMPADIMRALVNRALMPLAYERSVWQTIMFVACAVLNKYECDHGREWKMALEDHLEDRSYLFGRLLAVYEKIEKDTYTDDDKRTTNAIKMMSIFKQRPYYMSDVIYEKIRMPYLEKLPFPLQTNYHKELENISALIDGLRLTPEELNRPVGPSFIFGYNLEMKKLYEPSKKNEKTEEENND